MGRHKGVCESSKALKVPTKFGTSCNVAPKFTTCTVRPMVSQCCLTLSQYVDCADRHGLTMDGLRHAEIAPLRALVVAQRTLPLPAGPITN